jgi:hypothetical protein
MTSCTTVAVKRSPTRERREEGQAEFSFLAANYCSRSESRRIAVNGAREPRLCGRRGGGPLSAFQQTTRRRGIAAEWDRDALASGLGESGGGWSAARESQEGTVLRLGLGKGNLRRNNCGEGQSKREASQGCFPAAGV